MSDGGMGSLYFVSGDEEPKNRKFGRRIGEMQFEDTDGIPILVSLNIDEDGNLYELDIWKADFSPVHRLDLASGRPPNAA
jgi:hypothetical protein